MPKHLLERDQRLKTKAILLALLETQLKEEERYIK